MDSADEDMMPPPLPDEEPVDAKPPTPPPLPPLSMQTSNQVRDGLDFDSDVGGQPRCSGVSHLPRRAKIGESQSETTEEEEEEEEEEEGEIPDSDDGEVGRGAGTMGTKQVPSVLRQTETHNMVREEGEIQEGSRNSLRKRKAVETSKACKKSKNVHSMGDLAQGCLSKPTEGGAISKKLCVNETCNSTGVKVENAQLDTVNFAGDDQLEFVTFESSSQSIVQHARPQNTNQIPEHDSAKVSVSHREKLPSGDHNGDTLSKQEFEIIDDIGSDDEGPYEFDSDMDEDEIEALLDEGLQQYRMRHDGSDAGSNEEEEFAAPIEREKVVLKGKLFGWDQLVLILYMFLGLNSFCCILFTKTKLNKVRSRDNHY